MTPPVDHDTLRTLVREAVEADPALIATLRADLHALSPQAAQPVDLVRWVPLAKVRANDYNPNSVATNEMRLLYTSISHDGYTQPVVGVVDKSGEMYLPCGHTSPVGEQCPIWKTLSPMSGGWLAIPLASLTEKAVSVRSTVAPISDAGADTGFKSVSQPGTMAAPSVSGSESNGMPVTSMSSTDSATLSSGTSPGSMTSDASWELVCPTCLSSDPEHRNSWTHWQAALPGEDRGLRVSYASSGKREVAAGLPTSPSGSVEAKTGSEPSAMNSASPLLRVHDNSAVVIVDGFHRWLILRTYRDIQQRTGGMVPVVVIDKPLNDRMASTVRHNRARGKHAVSGMASMVFAMLDGGWGDAEICREIGLEPDELLRLKHVTGFSKLFENVEYRRAWESKQQIALRLAAEREGATTQTEA